MTGLRRAIDRIGSGVPTVLWGLLEWPGRGDGWRAVTGRAVWLAFLGWSAWRMVQHTRPVMALLVATLLVAAWRAGAQTTPPPTPLAPSDGEEAGHSAAEPEPRPAGEGITITPHPDGNPSHWAVTHRHGRMNP